MNTEQMIAFAREQLEIFAKNSQMGIFLQCVIDKLETKKEETFKVGDIVEDSCDGIRGAILDNGSDDYTWIVLNENNIVEGWHEKDMISVGATNLVKQIVKELR